MGFLNYLRNCTCLLCACCGCYRPNPDEMTNEIIRNEIIRNEILQERIINSKEENDKEK
jgi:hypothetical protein